MIYLVAGLMVAGFVVGLERFGVVASGRGALEISRAATDTVRDGSLDDAAKERAMRSASLRLFRAFGSILIRSGASVALSLVPLVVADRLGWVAAARVTDWFLTPAGIILPLLGVGAWFALRPAAK